MFKKRIIVKTHKARFIGNDALYLFINVKNQCKYSDVTITNISISDTRVTVQIIEPKRPLPITLLPGNSWETWIKYGNLTYAMSASPYELVTVQLSNGKTYKSKHNTHVAPSGAVPNGSY